MKKRPGFAHFLKKNRYVTSDWLWTSSSFLYDHRSTIMLFKLADSVLRLVQTGRVKRSGIESFLTPCIFCKHKKLDYPTVWTHANNAGLNKPLSWHSFCPRSDGIYFMLNVKFHFDGLHSGENINYQLTSNQVGRLETGLTLGGRHSGKRRRRLIDDFQVW